MRVCNTPLALFPPTSNYMVSIPKPIGITFKKSLEGYVYVAALDEHGNAAKSGLVIVGDILRKTSAVFGDEMWTSEDFERTLHAIRARQGGVMERKRKKGREWREMNTIYVPWGFAFRLGQLATATEQRAVRRQWVIFCATR